MYLTRTNFFSIYKLGLQYCYHVFLDSFLHKVLFRCQLNQSKHFIKTLMFCSLCLFLIGAYFLCFYPIRNRIKNICSDYDLMLYKHKKHLSWTVFLYSPGLISLSFYFVSLMPEFNGKQSTDSRIEIYFMHKLDHLLSCS